jgi:hypothetical protein
LERREFVLQEPISLQKPTVLRKRKVGTLKVLGVIVFMTKLDQEAIAIIQILDRDKSDIPASVIARILEGMQQIIYILATYQDKQNIRQLKSKYLLLLESSQWMNSTLEINIKLSNSINYREIFTHIYRILNEISRDDFDTIKDIFPES